MLVKGTSISKKSGSKSSNFSAAAFFFESAIVASREFEATEFCLVWFASIFLILDKPSAF